MNHFITFTKKIDNQLVESKCMAQELKTKTGFKIIGDDNFSGTYYLEFDKEAVHAIILGNVHVEVVSFTINDEAFEMSYPLKTNREPEEFISLRNHHFNIDQRITVKDMYGSSHSYNLKDIVKDEFIKNEERYVPFH